MPSEEPLRRNLRVFDVFALAVGSVIGTGIFTMPGRAAARMGPAALLTLLVGAALSGLLVLCYAEAASRFRGTGGAMRYAQVGLGDLAAFQVGWATWIARVVSWGALANMFVISLKPLWPEAGAWRTELILGLFLVLLGVNLVGVGLGGRVNTLLTVLKLGPLLAFIGIGLFHVDSAHFTPFAPHGLGELGGTTVLMLYAFVGFEGAVIPAAEVRDPRRNLPRALLAGMATVFVIYLGVWTVCTGTLEGLAGLENPVGDAASTFLGPVGAQAIQVGIVLSVIGINAFMALVTPRALYAMSHENLFPRWFGGISGRQVPARAIWFTGILAVGLALSQGFKVLAVISVVARLVQYIATCFAVLALRRRPDAPPAEFVVSGGAVLPLAAVAVCLWLLYETSIEELLAGLAAVAVGLLVYLPWRSWQRRAGDGAPSEL